MYLVYKIREKKTDKVVYIGETKQPWKRWRSHVEKYGQFNRIEHYLNKQFPHRLVLLLFLLQDTHFFKFLLFLIF